DQLAALMLRYAMPAIYSTREFAIAGGVMSYGPSIRDAWSCPVQANKRKLAVRSCSSESCQKATSGSPHLSTSSARQAPEQEVCTDHSSSESRDASSLVTITTRARAGSSLLAFLLAMSSAKAGKAQVWPAR